LRWSLALLLSIGCATKSPDPRPTLDAYSAALKAKDVRTIHALSEAPPSLDQLAVLADDDESYDDARARLKGPLVFSTYAEAVAPDGRRVRLRLGPEGWRVVEGGLEPIADTPEHALSVFFAAVASGDLGRVRRVIPEADRQQLASDEALGAMLQGLRPRIDAASTSLSKVAPGSARIAGDLAYLDYGPRQTVRFRREAARWRILDLE
jgi:hypothetical protein